MIELISAAKVGKKNRNRCITAGKSCIKSGKMSGPLAAFMRRRVKRRAETVKNIWRFRFLLLPLPAEKILMVRSAMPLG